jgi:hypothetical protein
MSPRRLMPGQSVANGKYSSSLTIVCQTPIKDRTDKFSRARLGLARVWPGVDPGLTRVCNVSEPRHTLISN